jgi:quinol monooxygenase YgiN
MSKVAMIAKLTAVEGRRDELVAALEKIFDSVENEQGTLVYALHTDSADESAVWFYELYADNAALETHSTSEGMSQMISALPGLVAGAPEMHVLAPVRAKGVDVG